MRPMNYELTINKLVLCISDCKLLVNEALGCESFPWGLLLIGRIRTTNWKKVFNLIVDLGRTSSDRPICFSTFVHTQTVKYYCL